MLKSMQLLKTSRKLHKWLMAFIGIQFVIWSVTGAYMVFLDIDYIHGDTLVMNAQDKIDPQQIQFSLADLYQAYPEANKITLARYLNQTVYRFELHQQQLLVDASSGQLLPALTRQQAEQVAKAAYSGSGNVLSAVLISENPPFELNPAVLPAWQINFDDFAAPALYISAQSGRLVGKRHNFWRLFDWMFRFHVMDYDDGDDIDNIWLFLCAIGGLTAAVFGLILAYFRVFRSKDPHLTAPTADDAQATTAGAAL